MFEEPGTLFEYCNGASFLLSAITTEVTGLPASDYAEEVLFLETATSARVEAGTVSDSYGYQWWVDRGGCVMALGVGGQYLVVVPDQDLVVVFTSGLSPSGFSRPEEITTSLVIPAVLSDGPLSANAVFRASAKPWADRS